MLQGIVSTGRYTVVNSNGNSLPYVSTNSNNPIQGMIRVQGYNIQVFDGSNWINMSQEISSVGLSPEAESLLDWTRQKRNEELELEILAQTNPTIKDLVEQLKEKQHQIKMVQTLIKKETTV
jgi:hypothetical protein